tara:strand:- start:43 stop:300 length:258 start_codon:yes stop_codon:yes gene_type:complete
MAEPARSSVPEHWQPVRILHALDTSRSLGWPKENRNFVEMHTWCKKHSKHDWRMVLNKETVATFWFESRRDAQEFALRWFPFKCV